ncbi:MAG: hypothetical protein QOF62_106 [Pyrinomonadaceae bacterium]|nr:hypothetical protein [Pyrinomonadaceae bacterium]
MPFVSQGPWAGLSLAWANSSRGIQKRRLRKLDSRQNLLQALNAQVCLVTYAWQKSPDFWRGFLECDLESVDSSRSPIVFSTRPYKLFFALKSIG